MSSTTRQTSWLITGASRGLGLELVRQLLQSPDNLVLAACRAPDKAAGLHDLQKTAKGTLHLVQLDTSDWDSVRALPKQLEPILGEAGLDHLVNNAGISVHDTAFTLDPAAALGVFRTNTLGPALVSQAALPLLEKGRAKKILHVSSTLGSVSSAAPFGAQGASYSMSKAALNMLTCKQKLERPDLTAIALCPGWVKTDMGSSAAPLEPAESIAGLLKVIAGATNADSGKYIRYNGEIIPW